MPKSTFNDRNNGKSDRFKEVLITKESYDGFPKNKLFDNYSLAYFTARLAHKAVESIDNTDILLTN